MHKLVMNVHMLSFPNSLINARRGQNDQVAQMTSIQNRPMQNCTKYSFQIYVIMNTCDMNEIVLVLCLCFFQHV